MKKFKQILAPTDLSPESLDVVKYAAHLAESEGAKLTILHVVSPTPIIYADIAPSIDLSGIAEEIAKHSREELESWVASHVEGVKSIELLVEVGLADEVIGDVAEKIDASVVVMATHGYRGIKRALLGSVTEWFMRRAPCPVLVVRPPTRAKPGSRGAKKKTAKKD